MGTKEVKYNLATSVTYPNAMVVSYQYDQVGNRTKLTYPDLTYLTYTYDTLSRLLSLTNQKPPTTISFFNYTYDAVGNRLTKQSNEGTHNYTYDNIYQLTQVQKPDLTTKAYNFDTVGNRTTVVNGGTQTYTSNILNQYTQVIASGSEAIYSYDLNGNLTQKTQGTQSTQYTYDYENRLKTVIASPSGEAISFTYDAFGRRISKEVNGAIQAKYLYDQDNIILDLDPNNQIIAKYIYGPSIDEPLAMLKQGSVYYYSKDGLGSVVNLTDNTGQIVESYSYDEYGNVSAPSQVGNRYLYTGREYDPEINLYYYRARYYDPSIGRFLQTDPIGYEGGVNLYTYVKNNPVNWVDPYGLEAKKKKALEDWLKFNRGLWEDYLKGNISLEDLLLIGAIAVGGVALSEAELAALMLYGAIYLATQRGPNAELWPGYTGGKIQEELNKSKPTSVGPEKNPTPPVLPPDNKWKKLLDKLAEGLRHLMENMGL